MKSTGCKYFSGYFDIKVAFGVVKAGKSVKKFVADCYFDKWAQVMGDEKCFVGEFKRLDYEQGKDLYDRLVKRGYRLGVRGAIMINEKDADEIDDLVTTQRNRGRRHWNRKRRMMK